MLIVSAVVFWMLRNENKIYSQLQDAEVPYLLNKTIEEIKRLM
jgi:hypothetical protein